MVVMQSTIRLNITPAQQKFFTQLVWIAQSVQAHTWTKAQHELDIPIDTPYGIFASVVAALCIYRSNWGAHPLAQPKYVYNEKNVHANNFALVNSDPSWSKFRTFIIYENTAYKSYKDISDFVMDLSDIYTIKYNYRRALACKTPEEQVKAISDRAVFPLNFTHNLLQIIHSNMLKDLDRKFLQ